VKITVNGEPRELEAGATVASVVHALDVAAGARGIAVALDGEVVRRGDWSATTLREGGRVEILGAIGGGR
jgi:sulfur carrier protein